MGGCIAPPPLSAPLCDVLFARSWVMVKIHLGGPKNHPKKACSGDFVLICGTLYADSVYIFLSLILFEVTFVWLEALNKHTALLELSMLKSCLKCNWNIKGKVYPVTCLEGTGVEIELCSFFNLGLDGGGWLIPHPDHFTPGNDQLPMILKYIFILFLMNIISPTIVEIRGLC